ncbi:hypothetical protein B0T18DRAFT_389468 [Schizothecium vesticola]|uniref:Uncharacterized protein n=1 Tax=Schizothecium vesticola TaxID=314040 RepID=A0AA40F2E0_9PEZI|nr:hypothetical protein B0T18DRAFT_389468 [Schizothecium vesticola]
MKPPSLLLTPLATAQAITTITRLSSATSSTTGFLQWISPHAYTHTTILAITRYEPQITSLPPPYPATVTQLAVTHMTVDETTRYLPPLSETKTTRSTTAWTAMETWLVSPPRLASSEEERELNVGGGVECLGTESCATLADGRKKTSIYHNFGKLPGQVHEQVNHYSISKSQSKRRLFSDYRSD